MKKSDENIRDGNVNVCGVYIVSKTFLVIECPVDGTVKGGQWGVSVGEQLFKN